MEIKILQVFYGKDGLPYKDKDRQVHFPIAGTGFLGASNTTKIKFYYDELDETNQTTWVAVSKLPNGKLGSRVLESYFDDELNEHYALLELGEYYTQYKGDVFISLQGYQGGVNLDFDEETQQYEIHGTPTIAATGSIKFTINYAPQFVGSGQTENISFQRILADLGTKLGIRAYSEHVEELPSEGSPDVFYVVNDDPNNPNLANIYIWNENTSHYIWVGDNTLDLGDYYTKEQGEQFEEDIEGRVSSVENELSSVAQGSPKGVYQTLAALQLANPDHSYIYIVLDDGENIGHWYYWNGSAWTDGGQYLSAVTPTVSHKNNQLVDENDNNLFPLINFNKDVFNNSYKRVETDLSQFLSVGFVQANGTISTGPSNFRYATFTKEQFEKLFFLGVTVYFTGFDQNYPLYIVKKGTSYYSYKFGNGVQYTDELINVSDEDYDLIYVNLGGNSTGRKFHVFVDANINFEKFNDFSKNNMIFEPRKWTSFNNGFCSRYGSISSYANYYYEIFEIDMGTTIARISGICNATDVPLICYFDSDNNFIGYEFNSQGVEITNQYLHIPENAKYILLNIYDNSSYYQKLEFGKILNDANYNNDRLKTFLITNGEWTSIQPSSSGDGFYNKWGVLSTSFPGYTWTKYDVEDGIIIAKLTGKCITRDLPLVLYFDKDNNFLSNEFNVTNQEYTDAILTIPSDARYIVINNNAGNNRPTINFLKLAGDKNYWSGKKILWLGTSIPATAYEGGKAYPNIVGDKIGATVINNARSGSHAGIQFINGSGATYRYPWSLYALSYTEQEIQDLLDDWDDIKSQFTDAPETMTQEIINQFKTYSYENLIDPYLTGDDAVDLIVFDHGYNDASHAVVNPDNLFDRTTFQGAMNYLIKHIYEINPRARICMISNYENQEYTSLISAQEYVADYWSIDIFRLDKKLGWSNKQVVTKHNWDNGYYVETNDEHTTTIKNAWVYDTIHPSTDKSGDAVKLIANAIVPWIKTVV